MKDTISNIDQKIIQLKQRKEKLQTQKALIFLKESQRILGEKFSPELAAHILSHSWKASSDNQKKEWEKLQTGEDQSNWCLALEDEVAANLRLTRYPDTQLHFVKGKVEETIPGKIPDQIALLRLDTDWYASTRHELIHLYPRLQKNGVLLLDDYGYWQGSRKATDEYFQDKVLLHRIDNTGRILLKQQ